MSDNPYEPPRATHEEPAKSAENKPRRFWVLNIIAIAIAAAFLVLVVVATLTSRPH